MKWTEYELWGDVIENAHVYHKGCGEGEVIDNMAEAIAWCKQHAEKGCIADGT